MWCYEVNIIRKVSKTIEELKDLDNSLVTISSEKAELPITVRFKQGVITMW